MAQIAHPDVKLPGPQLPQLPAPKSDGALISSLPQKDLSQGGFSAGHLPGDAQDLAGPEGEADAVQNGAFPIAIAQVLHPQLPGRCRLHRLLRRKRRGQHGL